MKRLVHAAMAASLLAATATAALAMNGPTPTSTPSKYNDKPSASSSSQKLSKDVQTAIVAAQKAATAGDMQGALVQIKAAQAVPDRTPHDDFVINQFLSVVTANLHDYATAMTAYDAMLASPDFANLSPDEQKSTYYNVVIVADNLQKWQPAIDAGIKLEALSGNDESTYTVMAIAYYSLNDKNNATTYAQKAVDFAKAHNKSAPEQAQQLVANGQASSNPAAALAAIENIAVEHNEPDVWHRLIQHTLGQNGVKELDALYLYRLQFLAGAMQEGDDFTVMASLAGQLGYPTEETKAYEQGMASGKLSAGQATNLSKARKDAAADERALGQIAAAADKSKTGEQEAKLAEDYWGYGRYADVETAARAATAKGGLKDSGEGLMILGESQLAQGKYDDAVATFGQVTGSPIRMQTAHLWSLYAQARKKQGH